MVSNYFSGKYWWVSVIVAVVGTFIDACGWVIQKKSHTNIQKDLSLKERESQRDEKVKYLCDGPWWFGFITHVVGASIFSVAVGLGSQALLMPLQSFNLIFTVLLARKFLGERLAIVQIIGIVVIVIGCGFAVAFGPKRVEDSILNAEELEELFQNSDFLIFSGLIIFLTIIDYIVYKCKWVTHKMFLLLTFEWIAAFYGAWNALFTKCLVEIFATTAGSSEIAKLNWTHWLSYVSIIVVISTTFILEYWIQEALKMFNANYVNPIYMTLVIVLTIIFAALYFEEFEEMHTLDTVVFSSAVAVSFIGVAMIAFGDKSNEKQREKVNQSDTEQDSDSEHNVKINKTENGTETEMQPGAQQKIETDLLLEDSDTISIDI
eukprot:439347_1